MRFKRISKKMPRNMSFALTIDQVERRQKTVTRRMGWKFLKPGYRICAVKKAMGLKKGEKIQRLANLIVTDVKREPLSNIDSRDVELEGFPGKSPEWFIELFCKAYKCTSSDIITRIEFEYIG